jgi:Domain of unknown function (DUF4126)
LNYTVSGIVLAAAAGLNAYIPLLGLALADRALDKISLERPYDIISSTGGIAVLLILLTVEMIVDKIPRLDHINDFVNSAIRPAAGALAFMAITYGQDAINPVVAMILGLLIAGSVHAAKSISRVKITVQTDGVGNPIVSLVEDFFAMMLTLLAVTLPWLGLIALGVGGAGMAWLYKAMPNSLFGRAGKVSTAGDTSPVASTSSTVNRES